MFFDTDCAGVIHNIAYLRMIETCRTHLGAKMGMDFKAMLFYAQRLIIGFLAN